jgi:hypothetical protein
MQLLSNNISVLVPMKSLTKLTFFLFSNRENHFQCFDAILLINSSLEE